MNNNLTFKEIKKNVAKSFIFAMFKRAKVEKNCEKSHEIKIINEKRQLMLKKIVSSNSFQGLNVTNKDAYCLILIVKII